MVDDNADDKQSSGMLTVKEASSLLHIHPNTLRWWTDQGMLRAYRLGPRRDRRFKQEDITTLLFRKTEEGVRAQTPGHSILDQRRRLDSRRSNGGEPNDRRGVLQRLTGL